MWKSAAMERPRTFDFSAQAHWDLGPALGIIDFERGTRSRVARFSVLMARARRLARALINLHADLHTTSHGYIEVEPPFMVNTASLIGTGNLPKFEADYSRFAAIGISIMVRRRKFRSRTCTAARSSTARAADQVHRPTRRAFAARPARTARTCAG
jgi:hypothetical protein